MTIVCICMCVRMCMCVAHTHTQTHTHETLGVCWFACCHANFTLSSVVPSQVQHPEQLTSQALQQGWHL